MKKIVLSIRMVKFFENLFFLACLILAAFVDWRLAIVFIFYDICRGFEAVRENGEHRNENRELQKKIENNLFDIVLKAFIEAIKEVQKRKNDGAKRLYICGRISGDLDYQKKFCDAEARLRAAGYDVVNPARLCPPETDWQSAMRIAMRGMFKCEGIALLPDWTESRGAKIETDLAAKVGIETKPIEEWENGKA